MTVKLGRRLFLRGLGGAAIAAPFLSSVADRAARAQGMPSPGAPRRLIVMFTHFGCLTDRWFPKNSHGPLGESDYAGTSLEVLAPHAAKLLMPRGIRAMNEWTPSDKRGQGNDPHLNAVGSYFTCVPVTPHGTNPFSFDRATKFDAMPIGPSLDHVCAQQLNPGGLPLLLRLGEPNFVAQTDFSYSAAETPYTGSSLTEAFSALTGVFTGGPMTPDDYRLVRGKSLIDLVRDDLETLERHDMSRDDRLKLAAWKELLNQTAGPVVSAQCNAQVAEALGLNAANFEAAKAEGVDISTKISGNLDGADLYSNLAVLATLCNQSRVTFLKYPSYYIFAGLGISQDSHALSHRIATSTSVDCLSNVNELLQKIDRFYAAKFAHLVAQLDSFDEGQGTLLDNTATIWFNEMSDGNQHNLNNLPIIQAGSCGGYFKTGQAVNVEDGSSNLTAGNSTAPCDPNRIDQPGTTVISSGTPPELANAPINKYYCNLMNALGVKAGETGFPAAGGSAEVTHYGMYDDTTDFASGGANPPKINSPGGFDALKAT